MKGIFYLVKVNGRYIDNHERQLGLSLSDIDKAKIFTRMELLDFLSRKTAIEIDKQYMTDFEVFLIEE